MTDDKENMEISLQEQLETKKSATGNKFGTFAGVFMPTLLTILGVIMYLRVGWIVGNAGLGGTFLIILLAVSITTATGLSMSSITTNIRIGSGGAFSIISQSLGLEVGGSIGIPLYLAQTLAVSMYIFGFREGWQSIFPHHNAFLVDLVTFAVIFGVAYLSAGVAFRVQYLILGIVILSLVSIFATLFTGNLEYHQPVLWGSFPGAEETGFSGTNLWVVFAVFFPAVTGIMAGANMSGELKEPKRSIPVGTISAIILSTVVYLAVAYWIAIASTPDELLNNYTIAIDRSLIPWITLAGLLGATFSSGLSSLVGAPRILQALSMHSILPYKKVLSKLSSNGEPRNSLILSGLIVLIALLFRNLNAIAPLITMFFLITYAMINIVVFTEQNLGLISFRPRLKIPMIVPLFGSIGCVFAMFIINPAFSLIAVILVIIFYAILIKRQLTAPCGDVRSGLFVALAEWAARQVNELSVAQERSWKPNLFVPVKSLHELRGFFYFLIELTSSWGSLFLVGICNEKDEENLRKKMPDTVQLFRDKGVYTRSTIVVDSDFSHGLKASVQALRGVFFRPNILFIGLPPERNPEREKEYKLILERAKILRMGIMILAIHPETRLAHRHSINVWICSQSPDWSLKMHLGNLDMALLSSYMLRDKWNGKMKLLTVVTDAEEVPAAEVYIKNLIDLARLPKTDYEVMIGDFNNTIKDVTADLQVFGFLDDLDFAFIHKTLEKTSSSCLFVRDSGEENVFA